MSYTKISEGYVVQEFDDEGHPVSQKFIAEGEVTYENKFGEPMDAPELGVYLPFDMVQPKA